VLRSASIYSHDYDTEEINDIQTNNGVQYVVAGDLISWSSDPSDGPQGFTVCVTGAPTVSPTSSSPTTVPFAPFILTFSSPVSCSSTRVTGHRYTQFCTHEFCANHRLANHRANPLTNHTVAKRTNGLANHRANHRANHLAKRTNYLGLLRSGYEVACRNVNLLHHIERGLHHRWTRSIQERREVLVHGAS
jgi:hypothetical protein